MFGFEVNSRTLDSCICENIEVWKCANLCLVLHEKFSKNWIVIVGVEFCEIIKRDSSLQKHGFFEKIIRIIKGISKDKLWHIQNVVFLIYFLIQYGIVECKFSEFDFFVDFQRYIIDGFIVLFWRNQL